MTLAETAMSFVCPSCAKSYVWKAAQAGRRAKCSCGAVVAIPLTMNQTMNKSPAVKGPPAEESVAAAVPAWAAALAATAAGETPAAARPRVGAGSVMANVPVRKGLQPEPVGVPRVAVPSEFRDVVLPIGLIVAGLMATLADATHGHHDGVIPMAQAIGPAVLNLLAGLGLAVAAVFGASAMGGIAFHGPVWQNVLKLCAVALLPGPVGSMADHAIGGLNGTMAGVLTSIALYFALFWAVFEMAWSDRTICVMLIWIIRAGVAYAIFKFVGITKGLSI